eukprot:scaffold6590_cov86-Pinguiococcus_pyrenoidosus.AAC.1
MEGGIAEEDGPEETVERGRGIMELEADPSGGIMERGSRSAGLAADSPEETLERGSSTLELAADASEDSWH